MLATLITLVGSLFAAAESAMRGIPEGRLEHLAREGPHARAFARYRKSPTRISSRWLIGRIVCVTAAAALAHEAIYVTGAQRFALWGSVLGSVAIHGTLTETLDTLARQRAEVVAALALRFLRPLEFLLIPLAGPFALLARVIGRNVPTHPRITEHEVTWVIDAGQKSGAIDRQPAEMIRNVLDFKDLEAKDVLVPRPRVHSLEISQPLREVFSVVAREAHSRYPVYRDSPDNVIGLLYAKDLFQVVEDNALDTRTLGSLLRIPVLFVTEGEPLSKMLREMQLKRSHLAVVVDEFGGVSGIVTLEDILEEIVGDIRDEYDVDPPMLDLPDGNVLADAAVSLAELSRKFDLSMPDGEFESLGGLIVNHLGYVPSVGATFEISGLRLIVREADERHVMKVEIVNPRIPDDEHAA